MRAEVRQPVRGRDVSDELAAVVEETGAELLVIGVEKRSAVGTLLMGVRSSCRPGRGDDPPGRLQFGDVAGDGSTM